MSDMEILDMATLGAVLREAAKRSNLSPTAMVRNNGSLIGIATGSRAPGDAAIGPILRVLSRVGWEAVARPLSGHGIVITRKGALPLMTVGADGGPIEIPMTDISDVPQALLTMAAAGDKTISRMVKDAGSNSTSLVSFATGNGGNKDVYLLPLLRIFRVAEFGLYARPQFRSKRDARLRLEAGRLLASK